MCVLAYGVIILIKPRKMERGRRNVGRKEAVDHVMKVDSGAYGFDGAEQLIADS